MGTLRGVMPAAMIGVVAGMDNLAAALAMGALLFAGPLSAGMGLGVGVVLLGGALISLIVALRSALPNSVALVQETTIAIVAAAIFSMTARSSAGIETQIATAIAMVGAASITTGALFWLTGRLNLGGFVRFLPYPVVAGFLAGSGWLLIDGAASMLTGHGFGLEFVKALGSPGVLWRVAPAAALAIVMFLAFGRFRHPATMPLVMSAAVVAFHTGLIAADVPLEAARDLGHLPEMNASGGIELPTLAILNHIDWRAVFAAWPSFLVIAGLSMIGLMLNIGGLEIAFGRDIDVNAELRSSGIANVFSGGVGGASGFVGLSMTQLAERTGATGRGAGIATAVVMLLGLFSAGSLIFYIPVFLTGGFVLFLGVELLKEWGYDAGRRMPVSEWMVIIVILLTVALVGFMEALAVGLLVSSAVFMFNYSRLPVIRLHATGVERRSNVDRSPAAVKYLSGRGDAIEIVQLQGYLFFGTADRVVALVRERLGGIASRPLRFIVLDFRNVSGADSAAVSSFLKIRRLVQAHDVKVFFTNVPDTLHHQLDLAGIEFGDDLPLTLEPDLDHALEKAEDAVLHGHGHLDEEATLLQHFEAAIGPHARLPDLIDSMTLLKLPAEARLIRQGDEADDVYFVSSGRVRVQITLPNGRVVRVRTMLGGAVVGEIALYLRQSRTADVIVDVPSDVFRLSSEDLQRLRREDAELSALAHQLLATNLSEKLAVANRMIQLTQS